MLSPVYEYNNLDYVHIHVIYRVTQAEYVIRTRVAASQEYVNIYSRPRVCGTWRSLGVTRERRE